MTKGYYTPSDIRRDGLLKIKKLKQREAIMRPREQCTAMAQRANSYPTESQCRNNAKPGSKYCRVHEPKP